MGRLAFAREWLKRRIDTPDDYVAALAWAETLVRQHWLWPVQRLLYRLHSLERFAYWNEEAWAPLEAVVHARRHFMAALRELLGARLLDPPDWADRRRINRLLSRIEFDLQIDRVYCYPWRAYLELANQCNLRCEMCPQSVLKFKRSLTDRAVIENAKPLFPWIERMDLTGFGETLLNPLFPEALASIGRHTSTRMITNGLLLSEDRARVIVTYQLCELNVSIDSANAETYKRQRHVEGFDKICANIRRLVEVKREMGSDKPYLSFNFTLMRRNCRQLPDAVRLAAALGMQRVCSNYLAVYRQELVDQSLYHDQTLANEVIDEALRVGDELGVLVEPPPKFGQAAPDRLPPPRNCPDPWEFIQFRAQGDAATCCYSAGAFGDLTVQPAEEIWRSDEYAAFRRRVNSPTDAPMMCVHCNYGRHTAIDDPKMHFFVEELDTIRENERIELNLA